MEDMLEVVDDASMVEEDWLRLAAEEVEQMDVGGRRRRWKIGGNEFNGGWSWKMDAEVATKSGERVLLVRE